jgi:hypothetical protein
MAELKQDECLFTWRICGDDDQSRGARYRVETIMQNVRNVKLPDPRLISGIVQTAVFGGAGAYGLYHSLFNVEGGHRAIVYNRFVGIREKVRPRRPATTSAMTSTSARPRIRAPPIVANGSSASIGALRRRARRATRRDLAAPAARV